MAQPIIQPSFAAGELSPSLYGRVDLAKWHVGAALLENFFVDYRGGVSNRTGTEYILRALISSKPVRLIPFQFSTIQTYALEFGDGYMRVIRNGGYVLETPIAITAISQANPAMVSAVNSYSNGDWVYISGVVGMTEVNGRVFKVASVSGATFRLHGLDNNLIDSTVFDAYASGGTVARVHTVNTPYFAEDLALLKYTQSADVMTLTHPAYPPYDLTRTAHDAWTFTAIDFEPEVAAPANPEATPSAAGSTTYNYVITAVAANGVQESRPSVVADADSEPMSTTTGAHIDLTWDPVPDVVEYDIYRTNEIIDAAPGSGALYGFVGSAVDTNFKDQNIVPDFTRTPPIAFNPFEGGAYPGCATYFDGRKVYGNGTNTPQRLVTSKTGDFNNMDYSIPTRADDSIIETLASQQVNQIKHLVATDSLIVLTSSGAWKVDGGSGSDVITPTQIVAKPQAYNGCSDVPPLLINYDILYVQAKGSIVRDLSYNFYVNIFTGTDMSTMSNHLFLGHRITEWCWAEEPHKLIWAVRDDGVLLSFAFLKEQDVYAWSHHTTKGRVRSICSISEGDEDAVYVVVERKVNGMYVKFIERLVSRNMRPQPEFETPANLDLAWFVDAGRRYPLTYPDAILYPHDNATASNLSIYDVDIVSGGEDYTAPVATVTDQGGEGSGAELMLTVAGGIITGVTVVNAGSGYSNPLITIFDDDGSGAVLHALLTNDVEFETSVAVTVNVGDVLRANSGQGIVRVINSPTSITVNVTRPLLNDWYVDSGSWSCTAPVTEVSGLEHLEGETVSILADGNVQAQQEVVGGAITLEQEASAIVVGLPYRAKFRSLYLDIPGESPTPQGKRKKISAVTARVQDSRGMRIGHNFNDAEMVEFKERAFQIMGDPILPITGDERIVVDPLWEVPGQVCIDQKYPLPCTLLAMMPEVGVGDTP